VTQNKSTNTENVIHRAILISELQLQTYSRCSSIQDDANEKATGEFLTEDRDY
jgi:hypothetical protein